MAGWLLAAAAVSVGCVGPLTTRTVGREARLKERAAVYWEARVSGDLVETYRLHEPNFRKKVTLTAFSQGRGVSTIFDYEITTVRIEGDKGFVTTKVNYTITHPMLAKPVEPRWREVEEQWRWVDGEWYRRFRFPMGEPYPDQTWWDPRETDKVGGKDAAVGQPPAATSGQTPSESAR
jgi:hypothetical protein